MSAANLESTSLTTIIKRNGLPAPFHAEKITIAVTKALKETNEGGRDVAEKVTNGVLQKLKKNKKADASYQPSVEAVQDMVETELMRQSCPATAKAYILYRAQQSAARAKRREVPVHVQALVAKSKEYFNNNTLGELVYLRTYARWIPKENRRETWIETVDRYMAFMRENLGSKLDASEYKEVREAILRQEVMPSMRLLQFAGGPARRCHTCAYNCSFIAPTKLTDFAEIMYLSMQGCGVGFTVESEYTEQLPQIKKQTGQHEPVHVVADSKEGWCDALTLAFRTWYAGNDISFDLSEIRPAGARLQTMGGKASGPEPLRQLLEFARERILQRQGRRLRTIDVHDIVCKIGECVVAGGVRRTAMISLSDLDDVTLRDAKKGQFFTYEPQRMIANNSAVYETTPSDTALLEEWVALMKSGSGERGIFNRVCATQTMPDRRKQAWKESGLLKEDGSVHTPIGTNPCGEIILQSKQFCNLSEVIARADDTPDSLQRKIRIATIIGTYQSTLTSFNYIEKQWKDNCESERLLGVSITGQWDCAEVREPEVLQKLRATAIDTNATYAKRFGIQQSTAVTAVKPSGTVSQTLDCSSGIHPRHAAYYVRRIRISATDAICKMLRDQGVPHHPEVGQGAESATTYVLEFPVRAPAGSTFKEDLSAIEQLEYWKNVKCNYTEHNPSATISVGDGEWIDVVAWVQQHWQIVGGLSFLPRFDHVYQLAPYESISKSEYEARVAQFPEIDFAKLVHYELTDTTEQKRELACAGGTCELESV